MEKDNLFNQQLTGHIYLRSHESYDKYNAYKLGKSESCLDRESSYISGEIIRGNYILVLKVLKKDLDKIEKELQEHFKKKEYHIYHGGGTEFFNKIIKNEICPYLKEKNIDYEILDKSELDRINKIGIPIETLKKPSKKTPKKIPKERPEIVHTNLTPRIDQEEIINKSYEHFQKENKGMLILMCGVGKTLISLWITQKLNLQKIIIGVPNKLLVKQWSNEIKKIFPTINDLLVEDSIEINDIKYFLNTNESFIIITTYSSCHKVVASSKDLNIIFDMKINDECHHLTSSNMEIEKTTKKFVEMLKIDSIKQLSLTATSKKLETSNTDLSIVSNDDTTIFGEIIDKKNLLWAINKNIICDYVIQTIISKEEQIQDIFNNLNIKDENDKILFLSAYASLKSINDDYSHHLLIYSNNKENSLKLIKYIDLLLDKKYFEINNLYYSNYEGDMKTDEQDKIIDNFDESTFGIISCVYCLGEGWDFPKLDGVVFAENMKSNIRIVQSALRASRKNKEEPNKITKIILPILNRESINDTNNDDFKKVTEVIYQMGLEDESICQKIKVFLMDVKKQKPKKKIKKPEIIELGIYDDELTKLILKTVKRDSLKTTYEKAKKIIAEKNIKSKEEYYKLCEDNIKLSEEPEIIYKGKFTNWIDYLSIKRVYYDLKTCKSKVAEYLANETSIDFELTNITKNLKLLDNKFPPCDLWCDYYDINDLTEIIKETNQELVNF
jgi:superfamily II DNA or RNA helicase